MNLPVHQKTAMDLLPPNAKQVIEAIYVSPKLCQMLEPQAKAEILNAITISMAEANRGSGDAQAKAMLVNSIWNDCKGKLNHLKLGEFQLALKEGVRGEFGEFTDINVTTIHKWIKAFANSTLRQTSVNYYNLILSQGDKKPEPTPEERENIIKTGCIKAYEVFLKDGSLPVAVTAIYDYLKKAKDIKWTETEKQAITRQAEKVYKQRQKEGGIKVNEGVDGLKVEKKRAALHAYFHRCKGKGLNSILP